MLTSSSAPVSAPAASASSGGHHLALGSHSGKQDKNSNDNATSRKGRGGGPQLDAVPSFISLVPFHTRPTIKRIPDGLAGGPLRCQRRPRRRRRRRRRPGRSGGSGGSLVKANLVLIQSIWRRERNNLNAARAERGGRGRAVAPQLRLDPLPERINSASLAPSRWAQTVIITQELKFY